MQMTPEDKAIGQGNFNNAVGATRRDFLAGTVAAGAATGATYFGYKGLSGDRIKVGFIGTGDEGSVLLNEHPADFMEIVAIADLRPDNRKRAFDGDNNDVRKGLIRKLGPDAPKNIKTYKNHKELLADPNVEAVVIAVPLSQHAPVAIDAMKAGKHVLCEKLMAHNITECKEMIKVARANNVLLAVGHQRHYSVLYDNANHVIKQGLLGDIKFIRAQWHRNNSFPNRDSWRKKVSSTDAAELKGKLEEFGYKDVNQLINWRLFNETGGGLMAELGSHQLDACSIFLGKVHPIAVQGFGGRNFYGVKGVGSIDKQNDDREIDDHVYVTFEFPGANYKEDENDIVIVTYSSINTNRLEPYGETVFGSRGTMYMNMEKEALLFKEGSPSSGPGGTEQRLYVINGKAGPVLDASESLAPSANAAVASAAMEKISRGYTEEMEHFSYCIRNNIFEPPDKGGLKCNGVVAMADAIMALTANLAMKHKKRIVFKDAWFNPNDPLTPENDPDIVG